MIVKVSRFVRLALMDRMGEDFSGLLAEACEEFEIQPYSINFAREEVQPQNFYEGDRTLPELSLTAEPDFPALTFWMGEGGQYPPGVRTQGVVYSGWVMAHWRFFLSVRGLRPVGLIDLQEATHSAMIALLDEEFSGFNYRGDLGWESPPEQVWLDQDSNHVGFIQEIKYSAGFEVNIP